MKKLIIVITFLVYASLCFAQNNNPFLTASGTRWQGHTDYKDVNGKNHRDHYEIIFVANGTCIVSVRTTENGEELFQDGDGLWRLTYSDVYGDTIHIECDFMNVAIERLYKIDWTWTWSYSFNTPLNSFTLLVPPYPDAKNNVKLQMMMQTED